jgi:signal transduction histidine kinase
MNSTDRSSPRVLVVDDNPAIHEDFDKILGSRCAPSSLTALEEDLFSDQPDAPQFGPFRVEFASQGEEALAKVQAALEADDPYAVAFVDVRMPPGWDGFQTIARLWQVSPDLQTVICTAYSDYSSRDILRRFGQTDNLLVLKKPFETIEVLQLAQALSRKWSLARQARLRLEDLERLAQQRAQELCREVNERARAERALLQAQKLEVVGRLVAGVAHEFNNVLTIIQGNAVLLEAKLAGKAALQEHTRSILRAGERAARFTRQLLGMSRPTTIQFKALDLSAFLQRIGHLLEQGLGSGHHLKVVTADDLPLVRADEGSVEQVLMNLAINSRDAMPNGGDIVLGACAVTLTEVEAKARTGATAGHFVCLAVSDRGCGIPRAIVDRIFDPFFTTKEVGKGTGLGLWIVQSVARQHGGWVELTSEEGQGACFKIFLPAWRATSQPQEAFEPPNPSPAPVAAHKSLVVADS